MTECDLCGYKMHVNKNLDQSFVILKNEIECGCDCGCDSAICRFNKQHKIDHYNSDISSFNEGEVCSECIFILYNQLQKQKECETYINTQLNQILETKNTQKHKTNYSEIINTLIPEYNNLQKINDDLEGKLKQLNIEKDTLLYKKKILTLLFNQYCELRNDYEYKLNNSNS